LDWFELWYTNPGAIWQIDTSNVYNPILKNWAIFGANQCFEQGFVSLSDGRCWFYEDESGWAGSFGLSDLNFGKAWTVQSGGHNIKALEYDSATSTGYFLSRGGDIYLGQVYRVCLLETGPSATHEIANWLPSGNPAPTGTGWDSSSHTLYVVGDNNQVYSVALGTTDCSQTVPSNSQVAPAGTAGLGEQIMQPAFTPIPFGGVRNFWTETILDVYVESDNQLFFVLTKGGLYQVDFKNLTHVLQAISLESKDGKIHSDLAGSDRTLYLCDNTTIIRFPMNNLNNFLATPAIGIQSFQFAIYPSRRLAFAISQGSSNATIVDLANMVVSSRFNYTVGGPFATFRSAGGWAPAVDPDRHLVYFGVNCDQPTPSIVWQFDYGNLNAVNLTNWIIFGSDQCFNQGFVKPQRRSALDV